MNILNYLPSMRLSRVTMMLLNRRRVTLNLR
nr:MAG TPA: hypothetical protein [Caudoviricetes sp.]